jgi:hypothetical protein
MSTRRVAGKVTASSVAQGCPLRNGTAPSLPAVSRSAGPRAITAVAAVVVAAVAAGCGSTPARTVDAGRLEGQISNGLAQRYGVTRPTVTCPPGEANTAGTTFACHARLGGQDLTVNAQVHVPDDVRWQPAASILSNAMTAQAIESRLADQAGGHLQAACGPSPVRVVAVGASFDCTATVAGGARTVQVTATDLTGDVSLDLLPPATGPGATTPPVTAPGTPGTVPPGTLPGD